MDNFKIIYRILRYLEAAMDYLEIDMDAFSAATLNITKERWDSVMVMLVENGYIKGAAVRVHQRQRPQLMFPERSQITLKGLEYLNENSTMRKVADALKGVIDVIS